MAEEAVAPKAAEEGKPTEAQATADMELEAPEPHEVPEADDEALKQAENGNGKRGRGEGEEKEEEGDGTAAAKKQKAEKSAEEVRLEGMEAEGEAKEVEEGGGEEKGSGESEKDKVADPVKLGPKAFVSSVEMFDYFYNLLHSWAPNLDINKYEYLVIQDLLEKGHPEHSKKIGAGVQAFQIRHHPLWKSRCFFIVRVDGSSEDFSFRKCVDQILSLPDDMKVPDKNRALNSCNSGGQQRGGGRGGRGSGGRGGRGGRGRRGRF